MKYTTAGTSPEIKNQIYHSRNKSRNKKTTYTTAGTSPEIKNQIYHSRNKSRNKKPHIPQPEQVQKSKIKYTTAEQVQKSKIKYLGKTQIDTPNTQIHDPSHCGIGTGSSIKVAGLN
jgi:hypothetical protein